MLPDLFEKFEVIYTFLATFCFSLSLSTLGKILWEGGGGVAAAPAAPLPRFLRACNAILQYQKCKKNSAASKIAPSHRATLLNNLEK